VLAHPPTGLLHSYPMTQDDSPESGTPAAAKLGRWHLRADLMVLDADPLENVDNLTRVAAVYKGGDRVA
jgi:hypothetical protein